jgi:hypothetical protein
MPHWVVMLAAALGAWIVLVVVGGHLVGWTLGVLTRRRRARLRL